MQIRSSITKVWQGSVHRSSRSVLFSALLALSSLAASASALDAGDEKIPVLQVGSEVYSNVIVTSVTATDIYFTHLRGIGNAKLKSLNPDLQKRFHFDPAKASEREMQQAQDNALFASEVIKGIQKPAPEQSVRRRVVSVNVAEPSLEHNYYNLAQGKPPEVQGKLAATVPFFKCSPDISFRPPSTNAEGLLSFEVETVSMSIGLETTIFVPFDATQKIKDHEEGHRAIAEYFHSKGREAADRAGKALYLRKFDTTKGDPENSESLARIMAVRAAQEEYWKYTATPCRSAAFYYDQLTDSGRSSTNTTEEVSQSIERYPVKFPAAINEPAIPPVGDR